MGLQEMIVELCLEGQGADNQAQFQGQDIPAERRQGKATTVEERAALGNMHSKESKQTRRKLTIIEPMPDSRNGAV